MNYYARVGLVAIVATVAGLGAFYYSEDQSNEAPSLSAYEGRASAPALDAGPRQPLKDSGVSTISPPNMGSSPNAKYWARPTIGDSLEDLMHRAASSRLADDAYIAMQIGIYCSAVEHLPSKDIPQMVSVLLPRGTSKDEVERASQRVYSARDKVEKYCSGYQKSDIQKSLEQAKNTVFSQTSINRSLGALPKGKGDATVAVLSQEQVQAIMLSLTQPQQFWVGVDRVLRSELIVVPSYWKLSSEQRLAVQQIMYENLTGDSNQDSVRNVYECLRTAMCASAEVLGAKYPEASRVSEEIISLIRRQDWTSLKLMR